MRKVTFRELRSIDFSLRNIYGNTWYWKNGDSDDYGGHGRPDSMLHYLLTGKREYYINGERVAENQPGQLIFIPRGLKYVTRAVADEKGSFGFNFGFNVVDERGELLEVDEPFRVVQDGANGECYACLRRVDRLLNGPIRQPVQIKACAYELISQMCRQPEDQEREQYLVEIEQAVRMLRTRPEVHLSTQQLCEICNMSESNFRRRFAQFSGGLTPVQYRNRILCEKAEQLYRTEQRSLEDIASQLGFCDVGYLCRVYKQMTGKNFKEIRQKRGNA